MVAKTLRTRTAAGWTTKPAPDISANRLTAEEVDDNFLAMERACGGAVFDLQTYIDAAGGNTQTGWTNAMSALVAAGGGTLQLPAGVTDISGALQDTSGANAQLLLPSIDLATGKQITVVIRGVRQPPTGFSVVGPTPLPNNHSVLRSTLATGSGGNLLAGHCATSSANFTLIHLVLEDFTLRMPANPTHSAADFSKVANLSIGHGFSIDAGEYQVQAITTQPSTSSSYGIKMPKNNNGADSRIACFNVIGFYTGIQISEHTNAEQINVWGCVRAVESNALAYHASHIKRLMAVHCQRGIVASGGIHYLDIEQFNIEHAASGWWAPVYDIDDPNNYLRGRIRWHTVLAGVGVDQTFLVNGAAGIEKAQVGFPFVPGVNTQTASYTAVITDAGKMVRMNIASANNFTVPPNSSVAFPLDTEIHVRQVGAGATTIVAGSGVTINKPASQTLVLKEQHATVTLKKVATDTWDLMGMLGAA